MSNFLLESVIPVFSCEILLIANFASFGSRRPKWIKLPKMPFLALSLGVLIPITVSRLSESITLSRYSNNPQLHYPAWDVNLALIFFLNSVLMYGLLILHVVYDCWPRRSH